VPALTAALKDENSQVRQEAILALKNIDPEAAKNLGLK
jgi:HEAT repeat protein